MKTGIDNGVDRTVKHVLQVLSKRGNADSDLAKQITVALKSHGLTVTTLYLRERNVSDDGDDFLGVPQRKLKGVWRYLFAWRLYRYCKENQIDLVVAHRFKQIHLVSSVKKWLGIPMVGVVHGVGDYDRSHRKRILRNMFKEKVHFVAVSDVVNRYLKRLVPNVYDSNVVTINNAIDTELTKTQLLSRCEARRALGLSKDVVAIGTIGRLVPVKGHIHLLEAVLELGTSYANFQVVIIGDGREYDALSQFIEKNSLQDRVVLVGQKKQAARYLSAFDLFVLPSLSEGLPLALLEAMSAGLPVIGSDIAAISSVVPKNSSVFPVCDAKAMSEVIGRYLSLDAKELSRLGELSYQHVSENYNLHDFHSAYGSLVDQLLYDVGENVDASSR